MNRRAGRLASYLALSLALGGLVTPMAADAPGAAEANRTGQTSTLLPGGRELVVGGETVRFGSASRCCHGEV